MSRWDDFTAQHLTGSGTLLGLRLPEVIETHRQVRAEDRGSVPPRPGQVPQCSLDSESGGVPARNVPQCHASLPHRDAEGLRECGSLSQRAQMHVYNPCHISPRHTCPVVCLSVRVGRPQQWRIARRVPPRSSYQHQDQESYVRPCFPQCPGERKLGRGGDHGVPSSHRSAPQSP